MKKRSLRLFWFCGLLLCTALVGFSYWLEVHSHIAPCPLCSLQRYAMIVLSILFLFGTVISKYHRTLHLLTALCTAAVTSIGIWLAGRQIWLQWQPPSADHEGCGVSLQYLLKILPFDKAIKQAINGSAECSTVTWTLLHLSLAEWTFFFFMLFLGLSLAQARTAFRSG